jgi:hypothetical protein
LLRGHLKEFKIKSFVRFYVSVSLFAGKATYLKIVCNRNKTLIVTASGLIFNTELF